MDVYERIIEQAQKARDDEPIDSLRDIPLGMYGLTHQQVRLGNIIAIATVAHRKGNAP